MNWKKWCCLAMALSLIFVAVLPIGAAATTTEPAPTEPVAEPAPLPGFVVAIVVVLGLVVLVITWGMVIWLMRRVLSEPRNRL